MSLSNMHSVADTGIYIDSLSQVEQFSSNSSDSDTESTPEFTGRAIVSPISPCMQGQAYVRTYIPFRYHFLTSPTELPLEIEEAELTRGTYKYYNECMQGTDNERILFVHYLCLACIHCSGMPTIL